MALTTTPTTTTFTGGISSVGASRTHTFSAAGDHRQRPQCSGGGKSGLLSSSPASLRQEVRSPTGTVLGSPSVKCDGVSRQVTLTSSQAGSHAVRITKTAGGTGTTSYTATLNYSK